MREQQPSQTAFAAAAHRAAHQVLEGGRVFADPLALPILGVEPEVFTQRPDDPSGRAMRFFIAARSRIAETALKAGLETRGVRQLVVLGAGLDTFAYRNPHGDRLKVFEVDHPATQAWKRRRLEEAGVAVPETLTYTPVDFERDRLLDRLAAAGFDPASRAFFLWLGVVPYLTRPAIEATLAAIGGLPGGGEVVFDYADPPETLTPERRALHLDRAARVAALGEPFLSYFAAEDLHAMLARSGLPEIEDMGVRAIVARYAQGPAVTPEDNAADRGGHVILAMTPVR